MEVCCRTLQNARSQLKLIPHTGVVSGYFLDDAKLGVLSIPSFDMYGVSSLQFSNTVGEFLRLAKEAGITKIVVDVQQNYGGDPLLAIDTFRHVRTCFFFVLVSTANG